VQRVEVPKKGGVVHHAIVTDVRSLLWVTNQNAVTQHVCTSRVPDLDHPDICVFDLDPKRGAPVSAPCTWKEVERGDVEPWTFTIRSMAARIRKVGDVWNDMRRRPRSLKERSRC
jgi:DNA primase